MRKRQRLRRFLLTAYRHAWTEVLYLKRVWQEFRGSLLFTLAIWSLSTWLLHEHYPTMPNEEAMTWDRAAYFVLVMTAFEAALEFHGQAIWPVKAVFYALPLLGLFVIIDSIVRFTRLMFDRRNNRKEWQELLATTYRRHVIVCGLGHVGCRIVQQLLDSQTDCVAIDQTESSLIADLAAKGVPIIIGDMRQQDVLRRAGIAHAHALIGATDDDIVNIETGLNAKELAPGIKVILRIFDQNLAKKIESLIEIDYAFSTSALAAPVFAAAATSQNVINSFVVEDVVLNTVELVVRPGSRLDGLTLGELQAQVEVTFLMLQQDKEVDWNPRPHRQLRTDTKVVVVTTVDALRELESLNQAGRLFK